MYPLTVSSTRLNVTLDEEHARRLSHMASRMHMNEGTLARSLLSTAIDAADLDADHVVAMLDGIDGAWTAAQEGWRQAQQGDVVPLDQI